MYTEREQAIIDAIIRFVHEANHLELQRPTEWTHGIYETLATLGRHYGFQIGCTPHGDDCEWLYDLIWYTEVGEGLTRRLLNVPLVAECEWSLHGINDDFEKLLLANSETRVFICTSNEGHWPALEHYFNDSVRSFQQNHSGDRYLIALIDNEYDDVQFRLIIKE